MAERVQAAPRKHHAVHERVPTGKKTVEELEFQARILKRDECVDVCLADKPVHAFGTGIRLDANVRIRHGGLVERGRRVHPGDDAAVRQLRKDLADEEKRRLFVLRHRKFRVIEEEVRRTRPRGYRLVRVEAGNEFDGLRGEDGAEVTRVGRRDGEDEVGPTHLPLVGAEPEGFDEEETLLQPVVRRADEGAVIVVLDVALAENLQAVAQTLVAQVVTRVETLEEDGVVVREQRREQAGVFAAVNIVRQEREVRSETRMPLIIMYFLANVEQFGRLGAFVFKTMQDDADAAVVERFQFVINVDDTAVIGWVGDV